jgi:phage shock protein PspC (stress-responsive transcriptional regulator)
MEPELPPDQTPPPADDAAPAWAATTPSTEAPADAGSGDAAAAPEPPAVADGTPVDAGAGEDSPPPPPPPADAPGAGGAAGGMWAPPFQVLRSRHERKLGGVAGGLAMATGLDPTLVRLAIVLGCLSGWGILVYLMAWAIIPEEDPATGRYLVPAPERTARHVRIGLAVVAALGVLHVVGAVLGILSSALIGLGLFPARLFGLSHRGFMPGEALLGLLLLVGGLVLVFRRHLPWIAADAGPAPTPAAAWFSSHPGGPATAAADTGAPPAAGPAGPTGATPGPPAAVAGSAFGARASAAASSAARAARAARSNGPLLLVRAVGWLIALWFLAAALVGGLFWVTGALHVHLPVLPVVTGVAALGVLGSTLVRSRRVAAVIGAVALLLVPTALAAALTRVDGQAGHRSVTPVVLADLEPTYRHAAGIFDLDLSRLPLPAGTTPVHLSIGAGKIAVTVPWDAEVQARASVGAGTFDLFGNRQTGVNLEGRTHSNGQPGAPGLVISGRAGAGEIILRRASEPWTHEALRTGQPVPMHCDLSAVQTAVNGVISGGPIRCTAGDGVTLTPALNCVVAVTGAALCRPVGEPEPAVDFANEAGTRRCQIPAGGGEATCTGPVAGASSTPVTGSFACTIPAGGGPSVCRPSGSATPSAGSGTSPATNRDGSPAPPADPNAPPSTSGPTGAAPGEYRCTVPEGGGPATCQPA